ncbi:MAG TPA: glycosyltransferase, partial [Puia sp.]
DHLKPVYVVYDCMDELSAFLFAPPALKRNETALLKWANIVFTGGNSLYRSKRHLHGNIYPFPSSIDKNHFRAARNFTLDPADQAGISGPRIGFFVVIDERLDIALLRQVATLRPEWNFILIGPVVKIDPAILPVKKNIHYLGPKNYADLPAYLGGWNIAMMPFAMNASTRFISPTKTPEYLAGGKPVIAPSIADVIEPYGDLGLVHIADTSEQFIQAAEEILQQGPSLRWLNKVDAFLKEMSWDDTVREMCSRIEHGIRTASFSPSQNIGSYV